MSILNPKLRGLTKITYEQDRIISVCHEFDPDVGDIEYPYMTLIMDLDKYNECEIAMPQFLIGSVFEIIIDNWNSACDCMDDDYEHEWNPLHCTKEPVINPCGYFVFHAMPHEFFGYLREKKPEESRY